MASKVPRFQPPEPGHRTSGVLGQGTYHPISQRVEEVETVGENPGGGGSWHPRASAEAGSPETPDAQLLRPSLPTGPTLRCQHACVTSPRGDTILWDLERERLNDSKGKGLFSRGPGDRAVQGLVIGCVAQTLC